MESKSAKLALKLRKTDDFIDGLVLNLPAAWEIKPCMIAGHLGLDRYAPHFFCVGLAYSQRGHQTQIQSRRIQKRLGVFSPFVPVIRFK